LDTESRLKYGHEKEENNLMKQNEIEILFDITISWGRIISIFMARQDHLKKNLLEEENLTDEIPRPKNYWTH
jgi:hypothetical protein